MSTTRLLSTVTAIALVTGQMAGAAAAEGVAESAIVVTCSLPCKVMVDGSAAGTIPTAGGVLRVAAMPGEHLVQAHGPGGEVSEQRLVTVLQGHSVVVAAEFEGNEAEPEESIPGQLSAQGQVGPEGPAAPASAAATAVAAAGAPSRAPREQVLAAADQERAERIQRTRAESAAMAEKRFLSTGAGTTLHLETGLEWAHCDYLPSGTRSSWRPPTIEELEVLYAAVATAPHESTLQGSAWRPIPGIPPHIGTFVSRTVAGTLGSFSLDFLDGSRRDPMSRDPYAPICVRSHPSDASPARPDNGLVTLSCSVECVIKVNVGVGPPLPPDQKRLIRLSRGQHQIRAAAVMPGFREISRTIEVGRGIETPIVFRFIRESPSPRNPELAKRFVPTHFETVRDLTTGLEWMRDDNGWEILWHQAQRWCEAVDWSGVSDWRLPTIQELQALYEAVREEPKASTECGYKWRPVPGMTATCDWYWSSNVESDERRAWGLFFGAGASAAHHTTDWGRRRARCVRRFTAE